MILKAGLEGSWELYAPRLTPQPIVTRLVELLQDAVTDADFKTSLSRIGSAAMPKERATPAALSAFLRQEMQRWDPILRNAKLRGE